MFYQAFRVTHPTTFKPPGTNKDLCLQKFDMQKKDCEVFIPCGIVLLQEGQKTNKIECI